MTTTDVADATIEGTTGRDTYLCLAGGEIRQSRTLRADLIVDIGPDGALVGIERLGGPFTLADLADVVAEFGADEAPGWVSTAHAIAAERDIYRQAWKELVVDGARIDLAAPVTPTQEAALVLDAQQHDNPTSESETP